MKKYSRNLWLLVCVFSFVSNLFSQERTITGFVTALEKIAVVNAEVKVLSNKKTVLTDTLGGFKINCLIKDKIRISAKGFISQKIKIDENTIELKINLRFKPGGKSLNNAVGYGHIKDKDKSYAISNITNDDQFGFSNYSNIYELIANSSPSIMISGGQIIIRGSSSLRGSSAALVLVNGIEVGASQLSTISPLNVKSIDILKDGSAAIYGARGANGVVLITTKGSGRDDQ